MNNNIITCRGDIFCPRNNAYTYDTRWNSTPRHVPATCPCDLSLLVTEPYTYFWQRVVNSNLVPRVLWSPLPLLSRYDKDPGTGWSRDTLISFIPWGGCATWIFVSVCPFQAWTVAAICDVRAVNIWSKLSQMRKGCECQVFYTCLHFAIINSLYYDLVLI